MRSSFKGPISLGLLPLTAAGFFALSSQNLPPGFPYSDFPFPPAYEVHITPSACTRCGASSSGPRFQVNEGFDLKTMIGQVYEIDPMRVDVPDALNDGKKYDFALLLPKEENQKTINRLFQDSIEKQFHLSMAFESRLMDVYVLAAPEGRVPSLEVSEKRSVGGGMESGRLLLGQDPSKVPAPTNSLLKGISVSDASMEFVCRLLEQGLDRIVIDETHLRGHYSFQVGDAHDTDELRRRLREQIGLVLTPDRRNVKMLFVRPS